MTKSGIAKTLATIGGSLATAGAAGSFGVKWSQVASAVGVALVSLAAAIASSTSAGHPNGAV